MPLGGSNGGLASTANVTELAALKSKNYCGYRDNNENEDDTRTNNANRSA